MFCNRSSRKNGSLFDEKIATLFIKSLESEPLADRIRKWTIRREQLRKMADRHHAASGGPAVSLEVACTGLKADKYVSAVKEEEEEEEEEEVRHVSRLELKREAGNGSPPLKSNTNRHIPIQDGTMGGRRKVTEVCPHQR